MNYLTVGGYPDPGYIWPATAHIVGKDILRQEQDNVCSIFLHISYSDVCVCVCVCVCVRV